MTIGFSCSILHKTWLLAVLVIFETRYIYRLLLRTIEHSTYLLHVILCSRRLLSIGLSCCTASFRYSSWSFALRCWGMFLPSVNLMGECPSIVVKGCSCLSLCKNSSSGTVADSACAKLWWRCCSCLSFCIVVVAVSQHRTTSRRSTS